MNLALQSTLYIAGQWESGTGRFPVLNPATGAEIGAADEAGFELADAAIGAASAALPGWRETPAEARSDLLRGVASRIRASVDELARLLTEENGKPLRESRGELMASARTLEWTAEEARRVYGRVVPLEAHRRGMVWKQPIGVVVGISPWNFPASMLIRKIGLALAAGCTMVVKPAEQTPLIATALVRLFAHARCPAGVLNLLTTNDPGALVDRMLVDSRVAKISFTGSTAVGRRLLGHAEGRIKSVSLELGGHAPAIVFGDARIDAAVEATVASKFRNGGQSCTALNRLYVHESIAAEFGEALRARVRSLVVGSGLDDSTDVGPLIDEAAVSKLQAQIEDAVAGGATVVTGGKRLSDDSHSKGTFFEPTVLTGANPSMVLSHEEIFGPLLPVYEFSSDDDAVRLANDTDYGLAAYIYGRDVGRLWRTAERLEAGVIGINDPFPVSPEMPFGGDKNSGLGREGGSEGIEAYLKTKAVTVAL
ncbi:MAG: NAD-dependent succinate-semialdehyde dehydrogenase [Candidatus Dormibacter sp.]